MKKTGMEMKQNDFNELKPSWAKAVIVAEFHKNISDPMTDYFDTRIKKRVLLAWSKHTRKLFSEMRKAAKLFNETADLADAPKDAEHRENYTGGSGYYLSEVGPYATGWRIKKYPLSYFSTRPYDDLTIIKFERL
jgi:hypothetical protein